jgi:hypothetical protein
MPTSSNIAQRTATLRETETKLVEIDFMTQKVASISFCFCNSSCAFVAAVTGWNISRVSVIKGEASALFSALHFARANDFDNVIFKSDARDVDAIS